MVELLVQSCSKSKKEISEPVPALDLYSGYYYKIIKKARREGKYDEGIDLRILSAEHGLLSPEQEIDRYDKKMTASRADELRPDVVPELCRIIEENDYDEVVINMGQLYRRAIRGIESETDAEILWLEGGLGERGHALKKILRGKRTIET